VLQPFEEENDEEEEDEDSDGSYSECEGRIRNSSNNLVCS
jgi:hypothetical protein